MDLKETDDLTEGELLDVEQSTDEVIEGEWTSLRGITWVLYIGYSMQTYTMNCCCVFQKMFRTKNAIWTWERQ